MSNFKEVNFILEIRVRGQKRKKLFKFCNYYTHAKNLLYILVNRNLDFFLNEVGLSDWSLNLLFVDKLINRGDNERKQKVISLYKEYLLKDEDNQRLVSQLKEFKKYVGNAIFQALIREVVSNYKSYFSALKAYKKNPSKFKGKPKPPRAKKLNKVHNCSISFSQLVFKQLETEKGKVVRLKVGTSFLKFKLPECFEKKITSVRVVRKFDDVYIQCLYKEQIPNAQDTNDGYVAGVDIGLDNLLTIVTNNPHFRSVIINGRELKSFNQWYNRLKAKSQSTNDIEALRKLERYRTRRLKSTLHQITSKVVSLFILFDVNEVIIGKSAIESKQGINLGKKTNQNFTYLPFRQLVNQLKYKCEKFGIKVIEVDESYTSKCSALTEEPKKKPNYNGKRVKRGLFKDLTLNKVWNADCNGSLNIIKKVHKQILNALSFNQWLDKLSRPIRVLLVDIQGSLLGLVKKVACESFFGRITGSIGIHSMESSCHEVPH